MVNPALVTDDLTVRHILAAQQCAPCIQQQCLGSLSALVNGQNIFHSNSSAALAMPTASRP